MKFTFSDRPFALVAGAGIVLNLLTWVQALLFPRHQAIAILHYTSRVGIDFVGEGRHIMVLPAAGGLILMLNLVVGWLIVDADRRTAWVLWSAVPLVQVILGIALLFLRSLNV